MDSYNLNTDDYTIDELLNFVNYDGEISDATVKIIDEKVSRKLEVIESITSQRTKKHMKKFINDVKKVLTEHIQTNNSASYSYQDLVPKNVIPYVNANEYKYPTGVINPIEKKTVVKTISVDSTFRENKYLTTSSDFVWKSPNYIIILLPCDLHQ